MTIVVDTSAFFALLDADDDNHAHARAALVQIRAAGDELVVTSYVAVESISLVTRRLGMDAARRLQRSVLQLMPMIVTPALEHATAMEMFLDTGRSLSFVDCATMATMRARLFTHIFTFDDDFARAGFDVLPATRST